MLTIHPHDDEPVDMGFVFGDSEKDAFTELLNTFDLAFKLDDDMQQVAYRNFMFKAVDSLETFYRLYGFEYTMKHLEIKMIKEGNPEPSELTWRHLGESLDWGKSYNAPPSTGAEWRRYNTKVPSLEILFDTDYVFNGGNDPISFENILCIGTNRQIQYFIYHHFHTIT